MPATRKNPRRIAPRGCDELGRRLAEQTYCRAALLAPGICPPNFDEPVPLTLVGPPAVPFGSERAAVRPGPCIMFIELDQP